MVGRQSRWEINEKGDPKMNSSMTIGGPSNITEDVIGSEFVATTNVVVVVRDKMAPLHYRADDDSILPQRLAARTNRYPPSNSHQTFSTRQKRKAIMARPRRSIDTAKIHGEYTNFYSIQFKKTERQEERKEETGSQQWQLVLTRLTEKWKWWPWTISVWREIIRVPQDSRTLIVFFSLFLSFFPFLRYNAKFETRGTHTQYAGHDSLSLSFWLELGLTIVELARINRLSLPCLFGV